MVYHGFDSNHTLNIPVIIFIASGLLIGGFYSVSQIYQYDEDYEDAVITISYPLGSKGTFVFIGICSLDFFCLAGIFYLQQEFMHFIIFQIFVLPVAVSFFRWLDKERQDKNNANLKNTMRKNILASTFANPRFFTLLILK